jgi:glycosyltransferase involved in cell wall biosynthesis
MPFARGRQLHLLTVHDMTFFSLPEAHSTLHRSGPFRSAVLASIRRADQLTVPSEWTRQALLGVVPDLPAERVRVIAPGIDEAFGPRPHLEVREVRGRLDLPQDYILHVGTLEPRKNLLRLLEAYRLLAPHERTVPDLVLAGRKAWGARALRAEVAEARLEDRVHFVGYVPEADLPALYSGARLFVYPSLQEGFGFPPLEAMASGVPTIAASSSALLENLGGAAALVSAYDVETLAATMSRLLWDERLRRRLRSEGLMRAARFRWEDATRRTLECYDELAARRGRTKRPTRGRDRASRGP